MAGKKNAKPQAAKIASEKKPDGGGGTGGQPRLEWVSAADLRTKKNPRNWRKHPKRQQTAMKAALKELGWVKPVVFNEATGRLIDGHMRVESVAARSLVPVFVVNLTEEAEKTALLTVDSIGTMAEADAALLNSLLSDTPTMTENDGLAAVHEQLHALWALKAADAETKDDAKAQTKGNGEGEGDEEAPAAIYQVIAACSDEKDQERVYNLLKEAWVECRVSTLL